ncbi:reverse transcriptase [Elysia marginata]|uniref:Reverse transcriptase n=1 Tax=Elysia marginata TaxID=1093978 RepID=A0AAV4GJ44_9GAST|nr:reverse transcriptase [Elysia marginata]
MYYRKTKLELSMKSVFEEYTCGKARLVTMITLLKARQKWNVEKAIDEAKEWLKTKGVIDQTQIDRKGLEPPTAKWWSKAEGKEERDIVINGVRHKEDFRRLQKAVQQPHQG